MKTKAAIILLALGLVGAGAWHLLNKHVARFGNKRVLTVPAMRGAFHVTVLAKGKLVAAKSIRVSSPISWKPIVWLIPEGAMVKKDDIIVKFDKREIEDDVRSTRARHRIAAARLKEAQQTLTATEQSIRAKVKTRQAQLHIAQLQVQDLENRPRPDDLRRAGIERDRAKAVFDAASAEYNAMKEAVASRAGASVFTSTDLRAVHLTYQKAKADYEASLVEYRATKAGSAPDTIEEAKLKAKQAAIDLHEAEKELPDKIKQLQANIEKAKADLDKAENQLKRREEELSKADFKSPADGMIAYRSVFGKRLAKGMAMWKGATIFDLPDLSRMHLKTRVRENEIAKVALGQKARVRVDAIPDKQFLGKVVEIGKVAKDSSEIEAVGLAQEREDTGVRVFDVTIEIEQSDPVLKPNMLGRAEIIVWSANDVVSVPQDAIFDVEGKTVAYVLNGRRFDAVAVKTGKRNADRVVVVKGIEAGQRVCLEEVEAGSDAGGAP